MHLPIVLLGDVLNQQSVAEWHAEEEESPMRRTM
jgi:hypothetical protein